MKPLDILCRKCGAKPGEKCKEFSALESFVAHPVRHKDARDGRNESPSIASLLADKFNIPRPAAAEEEGPQRIDRDFFGRLVAMGRNLRYTWRRHDDSLYQLVRPDGSVAITFGPPHPDDVGYFNELCENHTIHIATDAPRARLERRLREEGVDPTDWDEYVITECDSVVVRRRTMQGSNTPPTCPVCKELG